MKNDLEIEVKFYISEPLEFRNRILSKNAISEGRILEKNILLDTPDLQLRKNGVLLRLRQTDKCTLTVKSIPRSGQDGEFKVLEETETGIEDFDAAEKAFATLGFIHKTAYEKFRETFQLKGVEICLDELPFGYFVELEGEKAAIREVADILGLQWDQRITLSYRSLFERLAQHHGYGFSDMTFAAFASADADIHAIL
ncbi:adenylate cyclase class 2 [Desulfobotulus alkaliphilus]|uniref:Adenylate cyclase class 2 n=1 Tax=Desulfobotulus alkaliphilus TaxID=622671 RepID=A0A562RS60_9BACT|nr:class IV adenylate cyclase [Desulfobotulus alkaliphilus]TWI71773.1 adenylate cyclase class 2 [Desulfobotulus alkaliphilus]